VAALNGTKAPPATPKAHATPLAHKPAKDAHKPAKDHVTKKTPAKPKKSKK
jgi:hypothetical protein